VKVKYTPEQLVAALSIAPQPALSWYARWFAFLITPFKFLGIDGWTKTENLAAVVGDLVRDAQHSTDGFYTLDVKLSTISMCYPDDLCWEPVSAKLKNRYIRLEVEPGTYAHLVCSVLEKKLVAGAKIKAGGYVFVDKDGPFLEIHPDQIFEVTTRDAS
jgi:hypothetical protein